MDKKTQFNNSLTDLVEFAATKGNEISMEDVKLYFEGIIEDESQYQFIYDYLSLNKIHVKGFTPTSFFDEETETVSDNPTPSGSSHKFKESDEELSFIQMYMTDLESIIPASASSGMNCF